MKLSLSQYLIETGSTKTRAQLQAELKKAEDDLKSMSVTPHSEAAADAIDDARQEVRRIKAELFKLGESAGYTAAEAYKRHAGQVQAKLQRISQEVQAHAQRQSQEANSWGYVEDLAHINEALGEIVDFISYDGLDSILGDD